MGYTGAVYRVLRHLSVVTGSRCGTVGLQSRSSPLRSGFPCSFLGYISGGMLKVDIELGGGGSLLLSSFFSCLNVARSIEL